MSGFDEPWKQSWVREADKVKELAENNAHLRAALVKAEDKCSTWRQRAEEAEECIVWVKCDDPEHERLAAAERTVREQREALERIAETSFGSEWVALREIRRIARDAAALAPPADEREGGE